MSWSLSLGIKVVRAWSCPLILYITLKFSLFSTRNLCLVHFEIHRPPNMTQYEGHKLNFRFVRSRFSLHCRCWYYSGLWMTLIVRWLKKPPKFRDFIFAKSSMSGMLWKFSALSNWNKMGIHQSISLLITYLKKCLPMIQSLNFLLLR